MGQRHTPTKGIESERINLKEDNYGTILFYIPFSGRSTSCCYHVEEAETYGEARDKMVEKFGTGWAFQYDESQWKIPKEQYERFYKHDPMMPNWFEGITQADLFRLKEI